MKNKFKSYEEAKAIVHTFKIKSAKEWQKFCSSKNFPEGIPKTPERVYKERGWNGYPEWLGNNNKSPFSYTYVTYEEAKAYVMSQGIKTQSEWKEWCRNRKRPENIPSRPWEIYKDTGWINLPSFLGTDGPKISRFRTYEEAKRYVHTLGIKTRKEWNKYVKSGNKPDDIPNYPEDTYENKGWIDYGDFLGTNRKSYRYVTYRSYEDAKAYVQLLGFKTPLDWKKFAESGDKPNDIPSYPPKSYEKSGWISWNDFLGCDGYIARGVNFKTYDEAREFLKPFGLKSYKDWKDFVKSGKKPDDIPRAPLEHYRYNGWVSLAHFLGYIGDGNTWTKKNLIHYLEEIKEYLNFCSIPQLLIIITSNSLNKYIKNEDLKRIQETLPNTISRKSTIEDIIQNIISNDNNIEIVNAVDVDEEIKDSTFDAIINSSEVFEQNEGEENLRINQLKSIDNSLITASLDEDKINFLINDFINNLWYDVINDKININDLSMLKLKEEIPSKIKKDFIKEYNQVIKLKLPKNWIYPHKPLLMQKLIAYRLKQNNRYGNWSGVGSGKTISGILAGEYVGAKNTLVITFNSTVGSEDKRGWAKEINDSVKNAKVYYKSEASVKFEEDYSNYLVVNYESFQQKNSEYYVEEMLIKNKFDFIILDEIQSIKQVSKHEQSRRRQIITNLLNKAQLHNPNLYVLAMSATPVINNLMEAKSLVEIIYSKEIPEIKTQATISNCMAIFQRLTNCGIRYKNLDDNIIKSNSYTLLQVNGDHLYDTAKAIKRTNYLMIDRLMLETKLNAITPYIGRSKGKTIIYTYYVDGIDEYIHDYLTKLGYRVCVYTGSKNTHDREDALNGFIGGDYDILVGSKPIGTGVDGLQKVSDQMIILSLPWTSAELVQLVGRINRKGSLFTEEGVEIIIPLVSISNGETQYVWDYHRYNSITYKKTIANAAVDGIIPDKIIQSKEKIISEANIVLPELIEQLKENTKEEMFI